VEYLVLEKRMWYEGPWVIREQIYETVGKHV
jgi:protein MBA1